MKILIVNQQGSHLVKEVSFVPRIGDQVGVFSIPYPKVIAVVLWPDASLIKEAAGLLPNANDMETDLEAIIVVE